MACSVQRCREDNSVSLVDGKATDGTLLVDSFDAFEDRVEVKRLVGFLPDEPVFYSCLSGREILELSAAMHGLDARATVDRLYPLIVRLQLSPDLDNYAGLLAGNEEKTRPAAFHVAPKLLILAEPTNGLDIESTHLFYDLMLEEKRGLLRNLP